MLIILYKYADNSIEKFTIYGKILRIKSQKNSRGRFYEKKYCNFSNFINFALSYFL